ncbi:MAG: hypothetical protein KDA44_05975 [Planctomycetales bacterium]|nr:hypothetical protein [Planctomycetales bacterium]
MAATTETWRDLFTNWPAEVPRLGLIVSSLADQTPFRNFWIRGELLLLERNVPDANGGRFVLISFDVINTVKLNSPLNATMIAAAGFSNGAPALAAR